MTRVKSGRRLLPFIMALFVTLTLVPLTAKAAAGDWAGSGTETDPYRVTDAGDLAKLAADVNGGDDCADTYFLLTSDIDLGGFDAGDGGGWMPVGNGSSPFSGSFDGGGHVIQNLTIDRPDTSTVGLFGDIEADGAVQNLGIVGGTVSGGGTVGGVVGLSFDGTVTNCYNTCEIIGNGEVGGVVGFNRGTATNCRNIGDINGVVIGGIVSDAGGVIGLNTGMVSNCYNTGAVTGAYGHVGGVVGNNWTGTVTSCHNTGAVNGNGWVGGVVGYNQECCAVTYCYNTGAVVGADYYVGGVAGESSGAVENCYNTGAVTGDHAVGGIVGIDGAVTNCYNTGAVTGNYDVGGVVGLDLGTVTNCYYNSDHYSGVDNGAGVGLTTARMTDPSFAATLGAAFIQRAADADNRYYPELSVFYNGTAAQQSASKASVAVAAVPFTDVAGTAWYYDAVKYVYQNGLMNGTASDTFDPNGTLTRAMTVTILYRNAGSPDASTRSNPFADAPEGTWFTDAVKWAAASGIVNGYGDGTFGPNDPVTKEQLAAILYRLEQSAGEYPPDILMDREYSDFHQVSDYAKTAVNVLTIQGVFRDIPGDAFSPQTPAVRAEVASMLYRLLTADQGWN